MTKELTPLEALENIIGCSTIESHTQKWQKDYHIVEKALNDYENLKLKHRSMQDAVLEDFKKLKALEIIKNKKVDVGVLKVSERFEEYNIVIKTLLERKEEDFITKQEFYLLKKVLL